MCSKVYKYRSDFSIQEASMVLLMYVKVYRIYHVSVLILLYSVQYGNLKS